MLGFTASLLTWLTTTTWYPPYDAEPIQRYTSPPSLSAVAQHHFTGEPFIVNLPREYSTKSGSREGFQDLPFQDLDSWSAVFGTLWNATVDIRFWNGRLSLHDQLSYLTWKKNNALTFDNFKTVREEFTGTYLSVLANDMPHKELIQSLYKQPSFIPKEYEVDDEMAVNVMMDGTVEKIDTGGMWMYGGDVGAGVREHIDTVGCKCSWSYMLFGEKEWALRTPPGQEPRRSFEGVQRQGDFIFWCIGYIHQTVIKAESVDVHGYTKLTRPSGVAGDGSYANKLKEYALVGDHEAVEVGAQNCELGTVGYSDWPASRSWATKMWRKHRKKVKDAKTVGWYAAAATLVALFVKVAVKKRLRALRRERVKAE